MITLKGRTKLTTETERLLVDLGGADPHASLTEAELGDALARAIAILGENKSPILDKIYDTYRAHLLPDD